MMESATSARKGKRGRGSNASKGRQPTPGTSAAAKAPKWTGNEEICLLEALESFGFGNWEAVSKRLGTRTPAEAKAHYIDKYVNGTLGELTWPTEVPNEANRDICIAHESSGPIDHTITSEEEPAASSSLPPLKITRYQMEKLDYNPKREDYFTEYDDDAEKLVSQLSFNPKDDQEDIDLKLELVDMYRKRLQKRDKVKTMVKEYQLVSKFFENKAKRKATSDEKSESERQLAFYEKIIRDKLRPFAQSYSAEEHENIIKSLVEEERLKVRLAELYNYRRNGMTTVKEMEEFEKQEKQPGPSTKKKAKSTCPRAPGFSKYSQYEMYKSQRQRKMSPPTKPHTTERNIPSSDLLTEKEKNVCHKTKLSPAQFLTIKTAVLVARAKSKGNNNQQSPEDIPCIPCPPNVEPDEWKQVIAFFEGANLI